MEIYWKIFWLSDLAIMKFSFLKKGESKLTRSPIFTLSLRSSKDKRTSIKRSSSLIVDFVFSANFTSAFMTPLMFSLFLVIIFTL